MQQIGQESGDAWIQSLKLHGAPLWIASLHILNIQILWFMLSGDCRTTCLWSQSQKIQQRHCPALVALGCQLLSWRAEGIPCLQASLGLVSCKVTVSWQIIYKENLLGLLNTQDAIPRDGQNGLWGMPQDLALKMRNAVETPMLHMALVFLIIFCQGFSWMCSAKSWPLLRPAQPTKLPTMHYATTFLVWIGSLFGSSSLDIFAS